MQDDASLLKTPRKPSRAVRLAALSVGPVGVLLVAELLFRLFPHWTDPRPHPPYDYRALGKAYGWYVQAGYTYDGEMVDQAGVSYPVHLRFGQHGFRAYGDLTDSSRKRIMVIGDSYTACAQTSDDKTWYHLLGDSLDAAIFAYGNGGYGSTQEYLIVRDHIAAIQPDVLIWQFCSNDFIDNYWALESAARYHIYRPRPYTLEDGSIVTRRAARWPATLYPWSHFLYWVVQRTDAMRGIDRLPAAGQSAESHIANLGEAYEPFARSLALTRAAMANMQAILPAHTRLLVFSADVFQPQRKHLGRLCSEQGIPFVSGLPDYIHTCEKTRCVRASDGFHWNDYGNDRAAAFLLPVVRPLLEAQR